MEKKLEKKGRWEGARVGKTDVEGLWGASLPSDLEIAYAETYAIYAYYY